MCVGYMQILHDSTRGLSICRFWHTQGSWNQTLLIPKVGHVIGGFMEIEESGERIDPDGSTRARLVQGTGPEKQCLEKRPC